MELLNYWKVIQKSLWILLLVVAVGLGSTSAYTLSRPAEFESGAALLLNPAVPSALVPYVQTQVAANLADSYTQLMHTRSFAESVVKELPFPITAGGVQEALTTKLRPNTLFYDITARSTDPERARQLVGAVLKVFLASSAAQQTQQAADAGAAGTKSEVRGRLADKLEYLDGQIRSYQTRIEELEAQPSSRERDDRLLQLQGQMVSLQQAETDTMVALAQMSEDPNQANTALVIDQPLPGRPISNNLLRNMLLALVVSLLIAAGIAFLRDYLDNTVHSPEQLEEVLGVSVVAALGLLGSSNGRMQAYGRRGKGDGSGERAGPSVVELDERLRGHNLVTLERPKSPDAEAFKVLRTNIQFANLDKPVRTLVVTSSGPGEGKSFTSSNLAVAMAQAGKRTVLVDADLRKPGLHKLFGLPNITGFTNMLVSGSTMLEGAMQPVPGVENLAVITSGPIPPNPSEVLNSQQASEVMDQLARQAEVVIYDTPPAGVVTDPIIMATRVDAVILVIGAGTTRKDLIARSRQTLEKVGVSILLPVLNRVKIRDLQGYYYYYHYASDAAVTSSNGKVTTPVTSSNGARPEAGTEAEIASAQGMERK